MPNQADGVNICGFIDHLDRHHKVLLLLGGLCLPFDNITNTLIKRFIAAAVGKIQSFAEKGYMNWRHHGLQKSNPCITVFYHYVIVCL